MSEIEFVTSHGVPDGPQAPAGLGPRPDRPRPDRARPDRARAILPALWTLAAAAAVVAPFLDIQRLTEREQGQFSESIDGWGRTHAGGFERSAIHGPRFGVLTCVAAAVLLVAAVAALRARPRAGALLAAPAAAVLATMSAVAYLDVTSEQDSLAATASRADGAPTIDLVAGGFGWWTLGAAACALAGVVTQWLLARRPAAPSDGAESDIPALPDHPDDEVLAH